MADAMPMCFWSQRQFALWKAADSHVPRGNRCNGDQCHDCLPTFQLRMKRLGRCEHPETMFTFGHEGVIGYRPNA